MVLERWFARHGAPPLLDLARSGAAPLTVRDLLRVTAEASLDELLDMQLDYGDGRGSIHLRTAIATSGAARDAGEVLVTNGAIEALLLTCSAIAASRAGPRRVLVGTPAYEALLRAPAAAGFDVVAVPVWRPGQRVLDLGALTEHVDPTVAAVLVNSPENPTGAVADPADLDTLAQRCAESGTVLVVDEVAVQTLDATAQPACAGAGFGDGTVVAIGDVSKALGLGGLRIGWLTTPSPSLLAAAAAVKDLTTVGNAVVSEMLACYALRHRDTLVAAVRDMAGTNLQALRDWVSARGGDDAWLVPPADGLVAFPRLPAAADEHTIDRLRHDHGVALLSGALFGADGYVRVGLGLAPELFTTALDRLNACQDYALEPGITR